MTRFLSLLLVLAISSGCTSRVPIATTGGSTRQSGSVLLYRRPLEIRLSRPAPSSKNDVLVIYATGDGGWHGLDERIFDWICSWGYPAAGFSSKGYLKNLRHVSVSATTTPRHLVRDFETVIDFVESRLELARNTPIVLVGLSRGAGLVVVAAGEGELKPHLAGVLAIALTREEEHVVRHRFRRSSLASASGRQSVEIKTYNYLPRLSGFPVMVIQSTHDGYLPAAAARALFGPDTDLKRLLPVEARNHRFSGGGAALYRDTRDALEWIESKLARTLPGLTN